MSFGEKANVKCENNVVAPASDMRLEVKTDQRPGFRFDAEPAWLADALDGQIQHLPPGTVLPPLPDSHWAYAVRALRQPGGWSIKDAVDPGPGDDSTANPGPTR